MAFENIIVETRGKVAIVRLNRPQALNALNAALAGELSAALAGFEADAGIACIVITGSDKAFAAGADIKEMAGKSYMDAFFGDFEVIEPGLTEVWNWRPDGDAVVNSSSVLSMVGGVARKR